MSKPLKDSEIIEMMEEKKLVVVCWDCEDEMFEGTPAEIKEWEKKSFITTEDWGEAIDEGIVMAHCPECAYVYHL